MAAKRLNKNLVVGLTLGAFVMMILLSVLMLLQLRQRDPKYFIELAQDYERKEDWPSAALFYRKAWERSRDARHLVSYGDMLLNEGDVGRTLGAWQTALMHEPGLTQAHLRRLELLLEGARLYRNMGDWEHVREAAQTFLEAADEPTQAQTAIAHHAQGLALLGLSRRDPDNAIRGEAALRKAIELAPNKVDYALDLATAIARRGRIDEAEGLFRELIQRHASPGPDAAKVRLAYARHLTSRQELDEAREYFKESIQLAVGDPEARRDTRLAYAVFLTQQWSRASRDRGADATTQALFDEAEAILRESIEKDPDGFDAYQHLAILLGSVARHSDVVEVCEARLQRGFSRKGVAGPRNRLNTFSLMIQASTACVNEAVTARQAGDQEAQEAWLLRAEQYVADARGELPSHPRVLSQSGRIKLARGLDREALEDLRAADEAYRSYEVINWENKLMLAQLHLKLSEAGAAASTLEEVLTEARQNRALDVKFWTVYAQALFQSNELDRALAISDQILDLDPDHADALQLKAAVYERQGRREEAGRIFERATGDRVVRAILTSQQLVLEGDTDRGLDVLREALKDDPADARLVGATVRMLLDGERADEAGAVVDAALAADPQNVRLQQMAVLVRENMSERERDVAMLEAIEAQEDDYQRALDLVGFYGRRGDLQQALQQIDAALAHVVARDTPAAQRSNPSQHRTLLVTKLRLAASLDDPTASIEARDAAMQHNVDGSGGKSLLGLYHMLREEYDLAVRAFREAISAQPTDTESLTRLGQCLQFLGRPDEAQASFERATRVNPNAGAAHRGLALLAKQRGDSAAFEEAFEACRRLIPSDRWVREQVLAREEEKDPQGAITRRERLLAEDPDDVDNLRRLVRLCEAVNDLPRADRFLARLLELSPDDKDLVVTASKYYRRTGRPQRSLEVTTQYVRSRRTAEAAANARILVASHYLGVGELDRVEQTLLTAVDTAETFEVVHSLAEFYLHRLDRPDKALPWFDRAVTRARTSEAHRLPAVMAARVSCLLHRKMNDTVTAHRAVAELRATAPDYPQGLLLESEVYAREGRIDQAIDSLTEYLTQRPDDPYALYQRALHQYAEGKPEQAVQDLQTLKRVSPLALDLQPRLLLARLHRHEGRRDEQLRELESLVREAPDSMVALEELVRAYIDRGRSADAERLVTAQINRTADEPDARWLFLRGRISVEVGDYARALSDFRRAAEIDGHSAEGLTRVLDLYLRMNRPGEGIDYYQDHVRPDRVSSTLESRHALLLANADRKQEAVEHFRRAMGLALGDGRTAVAVVASDLRAAFPPVEPGFEAVNEAIALFESRPPDGAAARVNDRILARLYRMAVRYDEAANHLERLIATCTNDHERVDLLFELAELYHTAGDVQAARRTYEEGLKYDPDNWIALNNLAYLLSDDLGEYELARPYAQRAVAYSDNPATLDTLGWIYVGLGEYSLAVAELSRAIRLAPEDPLTYLHLGEAYRRNGQFTAAANILSSGRELAAAAADVDLTASFDASQDRVERADRSP